MGIAAKSMEKLFRVRDQLKRDRERFEKDWMEIAKYINPSMSDWEDAPPRKSKKKAGPGSDIFDTTAMKASNFLKDGIQAYAFGRSNTWFRLALEDEEAMKNEQNAEWLQAVERHFYAQLAKSSFYDEGGNLVKCGADFATAVMMRYEDDTRGIPCYRTQHLKRCYIEENRYGEVDTLFRDLWLSPQEAAVWFGYEKLPTSVKAAFDRGDLSPYLFHQFIFPKDKYDLDISARESRGKPYYSVFAAADEKTALLEGGYDTKPFYAWRWSRSLDGDVYGTDSPGFVEISNVKQLQLQRKDYLRMRQLAARPPIKATEGLMGRLKFEPNVINYLRAGEDYRAEQITARVDEMFQDLEMMKKGINESYYREFFLILSQTVELKKTATEVAGIQDERSAMLTAFFGRLNVEFLECALEDLFDLELKANRLPPVPPSLRGRDLKIDMISPLAMMQKRFLTLNPVRQAMGQILSFAEFDQSAYIMDNFDLDSHARIVAEEYNMDRRVLRDMADVARIRETRAKERQAAIQAQLAMEQEKVRSDAYHKLAKAPEAGSPAEALR